MWMQAYLRLCCIAVGQTRSDLTRYSAPQHPPRLHPAGARRPQKKKKKKLQLSSNGLMLQSCSSRSLCVTSHTVKSMSETSAVSVWACWFSLIKLRGLTKHVTSYPGCPRGAGQVPYPSHVHLHTHN